ncbi:extracellular solute-binding protein [Ruminococcaceae bacterium OttesenSCG-928-L11]|nr:extracellular solute-binding protein [Ruminococcaceae bacterium OttesenSCG-928-L11]
MIGMLCAALILLSGCGQQSAGQESAMAAWERTANLTANETPEELYAAALKEDTLIVYSTSTRMIEVAKTFEKQYPGLTVQVEDIREGELYDMLRQSHDSEAYLVDIVCSADGRGIMTNEFLPQNVVYKYVPQDIAEALLPGSNEELLLLIKEAIVLCYNDEFYDAPPVSNWWELTEEQWRGKVYMPNPVRSVTTSVFLAAFIQNGEAMAQAYQQRYGTVPALCQGENAGHAFIRMLMENDVVIVNSSDEVSEAVAAPGSQSPNAGIMVTSKLRLRNIGYPLALSMGMTPFDGIASPVNIMMAGGAKNVNAAKLFIRWIYGEADGRGDGYRPYLQSGAWSLRSDVKDESPIPMGALTLHEPDRLYLYTNKDHIFAFWEELVQARQ